jgi:hypothetical protein
MRYLHCPACSQLVDATLDVCPHCHALMRIPRSAKSQPEQPAGAEPGAERPAGPNGALAPTD